VARDVLGHWDTIAYAAGLFQCPLTQLQRCEIALVWYFGDLKNVLSQQQAAACRLPSAPRNVPRHI